MAIFTDVICDVTKEGRKLPTSEYKDSGLYPIIDQGQNDIAGYTDETTGLFSDVPAIIFGDHTRVIKYVDAPFFIGADGVKILKAKDNKANYKFLYYALSAAKIPNTGYNRHFKWLKEIDIPTYSEQEQEKSVSELDKTVALIELRTEQLDKLNELVKSRFIEMFGDPITNNKNLPEKDFIDVIMLQRGFDLPVQNRDSSGSIPVYGSNGVLDYHTEKKCTNGIITGRSGTIGKVYYCKEEYWPLNTTLFSVKTNGNNIIYLAHLLEYYKLDRFYDGTGVPTLNRNIVHKQKILDAPIDLQNQFAEFVEQTDKLKFEVKEALEKLETLKKSLMQQYFG